MATGPSVISDMASYQDLDTQLRSGIDLIQDAYTRQAAALKHEVAHWKHTASHHKDQNSALDAQVAALTRRVAELERALSTQASEKKALIASKSALMDRYNLIKKSASQLEAFRKSIVSMVEFSPAAQPLLSLDSDSRNIDGEYLHTPSKPDLTRNNGNYGNMLSMPPQNLSDGTYQLSSQPHVRKNEPCSQAENSGRYTTGPILLEHLHPFGESSDSRGHRNEKTEDSGVSSGESAGLGGSIGQQRNTLENRTSNLFGTGSAALDGFKSNGSSGVDDDAITCMTNPQGQDKVDPLSMQDFNSNLPDHANLGHDSTSYFDHNNTLRSLDISTQALDYSLASMTTQDKSGAGTVDVLASSKSHPNPSNNHQHRLYSGDMAIKNNVKGGATRNTVDDGIAGQTNNDTRRVSSNGLDVLINRRSEQRSGGFTKHTKSLSNGPSSTAHPESSDTLPFSKSTQSRTSYLASSNGAHSAFNRRSVEELNSGTETQETDSPHMDAPTLYRHIRDILTPSSFELFATAVAAFNAGRVSASDTVAQVHRIVGPGELSNQMSRLIYEAMRESTTSTNTA
ncbi:hypothetical protein O5D80_002258 [Batrachochytrium dendrobatidis]|nr:hypothetical protein O5D80_002258 [Batrachochytrium dendrobatidis]